ncbi:HNH endonuclease [Bacillus cereus]|uniref:HNH endonuclease n=1 Tax=Bacillus cereus TaxID=1396 RepID=UPI0018F66295|nr:HNH endonuclease [Bacillus cereus]
MATWLEDIITAFNNLDGVSHYDELYEEVKRIRTEPLPDSWKSIIRNTIETHSSHSKIFKTKDLFYSVDGLGEGTWALRNEETLIKAIDISTPPEKVRTEVYRIIRDTNLTRDLKRLHNHTCQICGERLELSADKHYSEAHHIKPLGSPHNGPDIRENIIVLCPNHHALCDYGAIPLNYSTLKNVKVHNISKEFIDYHNNEIVNKVNK